MIKKITITVLFLISLTALQATPNNFERIPDKFKKACQRIQLEMDIPDWLLYAVPMQESSWNPNTLVSSANCIGLMQLHPKYEDYFVEMYWTYDEDFNIYNPYHNLWMGFAYLADLKLRFHTWELALAAYNAGPTRVAKWDIPNKTIDYIVDIKNMMYE